MIAPFHNRLGDLPARNNAGSFSAPAIDLDRIERAVHEILIAVGEDPERDGLADTPRRVARSYAELFRGLHQSPAEHLSRVFEQQHDDVILVRDIEFYSLCEHHLLPFTGRAHIREMVTWLGYRSWRGRSKSSHAGRRCRSG